MFLVMSFFFFTFFKKNNPVLIGEPGVGKTAIVEGLAQLIVERRRAPTSLRDHRVLVARHGGGHRGYEIPRAV